MKKHAKKIIHIVIIVTIIILIILNYKNKNFFKFSLNDILLLSITIFIGTIFIESQNTKEKKKEKFEKLIDKFENNIIDCDVKKKLESGKKGEVLLSFKSSNNILVLLQKDASHYELDNDIKIIQDKYNEYNEKLSAHIDCIEKIDFEDLERIIVNIKNKLDEIRMKIL